MGVLSLILQWVSAVRRWLYAARLLRTYRAACPVVSIGNLGFGGSGKTPVVMALARALTKRGIRAVILSRGYGGTHSGSTIVQPNADAAVVGDEPLWLARKSGAAVVVDTNRARAAAWAMRELKPDLFILDDGFSHLRLARDLDWLMIGTNDLEAFAPRRELRSQLRHAAIITALDDGALTRAPLPSAVAKTGLRAHMLLRTVTDAGLSGMRVVVIAAIAHPERFTETVRGTGATIVETRFYRDHAVIPKEAFTKLAPHDFIVITEKDAVKTPRLPPHCVVLETAIVLPPELVDRVAALVLPANVNTAT